MPPPAAQLVPLAVTDPMDPQGTVSPTAGVWGSAESAGAQGTWK